MGCSSSSSSAIINLKANRKKSLRGSKSSNSLNTYNTDSSTVTASPVLPTVQIPPQNEEVIKLLQNPLSFIIAIHDGLRIAADLLKSHVSSDGSVDDFSNLWTEYQRAANYHSNNEDSIIFPYLDDSSNYQITRKKVGELHYLEGEFTYDIQTSLKDKYLSLETYEKWYQFHIDHLNKEETVILPIDVKLGANLTERQVAVYKKIILPTLADEGSEDFLWLLGWLSGVFCTQGFVHNHVDLKPIRTPVDSIGLLAVSLQNICSPQHYLSIRETMKGGSSKDVWDLAQKVYNVEASGIQKPPPQAPVEDDYRFGAYVKMAKYGIPKPAVANKMLMEGVCSSYDVAIDILELDPEDPIPDALEQRLADEEAAWQAQQQKQQQASGGSGV